jgi:rRNA maturation endonuclease Nob1
VDKRAAKNKADAADKICQYARFYKVCEGCESVVIYDKIFCPICDAYRFDSNVDRVKKTAIELSKRKKLRVLFGDDILDGEKLV